jgi:hypothetical protein
MCWFSFVIPLFKCISDWGADSTVLSNLYRSLIKSKWITDVSFTVQPVNRISSCLIQFIINDYGWLSLGAFITFPVENLYVEANEPSFENRRINVCNQAEGLSFQFNIFLLNLNTKMFTINNPIQFLPFEITFCKF